MGLCCQKEEHLPAFAHAKGEVIQLEVPEASTFLETPSLTLDWLQPCPNDIPSVACTKHLAGAAWRQTRAARAAPPGMGIAQRGDRWLVPQPSSQTPKAQQPRAWSRLFCQLFPCYQI